MWTPATRRQHNRESLRYETDMTDAEWSLIAPLMPTACPTGRPRKWPLREIVNAIFYVMRGGIGWRLLPSDFPPRSTVFRWLRGDNQGFFRIFGAGCGIHGRCE
jgi:transposase